MLNILSGYERNHDSLPFSTNRAKDVTAYLAMFALLLRVTNTTIALTNKL